MPANRRADTASLAASRHADAPSRAPRLTLADFPGDAVSIVCRRCDRNRQVGLDRLVALFGPTAEMATVLARLTECDRQRDWREEGPCWAAISAVALPATHLLPKEPLRPGSLPSLVAPPAAPAPRPVP